MTLAYTDARTQNRPKTEILRISVGIPDLCEFRPIAFEGEIRERKEAAPRATRPANATITHFAEFWPGLYYRTSVNMGSVKFTALEKDLLLFLRGWFFALQNE